MFIKLFACASVVNIFESVYSCWQLIRQQASHQYHHFQLSLTTLAYRYQAVLSVVRRGVFTSATFLLVSVRLVESGQTFTFYVYVLLGVGSISTLVTSLVSPGSQLLGCNGTVVSIVSYHIHMLLPRQ